MSHKIYKIKKSSDIRVDYTNVADQQQFRLSMLKQLIGNEKFLILIDTNHYKADNDVEFTKELDSYCNHKNIPIVVAPTSATKGASVFGFRMKGEFKQAFLILISLEAKEFNEIYDSHLSGCDLMIGIQPKASFQEIGDLVVKGYLTNFFDQQYFENAIFDSIAISSLRTSLPVD